MGKNVSLSYEQVFYEKEYTISSYNAVFPILFHASKGE